MVKRERNEKEKGKKNLPWFLLFRLLPSNQSLFWGRHRYGIRNLDMQVEVNLKTAKT